MPRTSQTRPRVRTIEFGDPVEISKSIRRTEARELRNAINAISAERDPQALILIGESSDYAGRLAVVNHFNVPTAYLLYIAEYKNPHIDTGGRIPGPRQPDPHVTNEIREVAVERLKARDWNLTSWETGSMTEGDRRAITTRLEAHKLRHSPSKGAPGHKPLDDIVDSLIGRVRVREDDDDPTSFGHD